MSSPELVILPRRTRAASHRLPQRRGLHSLRGGTPHAYEVGFWDALAYGLG